MYISRKPSSPRAFMFTVDYDDGRRAYLWLDERGDDHLIGAIAKQRQEQGVLPEGTIASIRRVR